MSNSEIVRFHAFRDGTGLSWGAMWHLTCGPLEAKCHLYRLHGGEWCVSRHGRHMAHQMPCVYHHENGLSNGMRGEWIKPREEG